MGLRRDLFGVLDMAPKVLYVIWSSFKSLVLGSLAVTKVLFKCAGASALVAALTMLWSVPGQAQNRWRGGPSDWSNSRIMAARFGPDGDRKIGMSFRSARRQMQM